MAKIEIMNLLQSDEDIQHDLWLSGLGMSAPGRNVDEGGRLRLGPGKWVKVEVARDTAMSIEVAKEAKPAVSRETFVDQLTDAAHSVYDRAQEDEKELSDEAYLVYHDVLHALGISRSTAKPEAPVEGDVTIGYGHKILPGEQFTRITPTIARALMTRDLQGAAKTVADAVKVPLTNPQGAALVDFAYNIGDTNFRESTLLRLLNASDYRGAAAQFPRWDEYTDPTTGRRVVDHGLVRRRRAEQKLFLS